MFFFSSLKNVFSTVNACKLHAILQLRNDYRKWVRRHSWLPECIRDESSRVVTTPYMGTSSKGAAQGTSSSSSTGSELLVSFPFFLL